MPKNKFLKDNIIFMASTVLGGALGYFFHFVISRKLSVAEYGDLQAITSLFSIFGVFSTALSFFIIKYSAVLADRNDGQGQLDFISFVTRKFKIPVAVFLVCFFALMPLLKSLLHLGDYFGLISIGISVVISVFSSFYINSLQGWRNFLWVGLIGSLAPAVKLAAGYVLATISAQGSFVALAFLFSSAAAWLIARAYGRGFWRRGIAQAHEKSWREKHFSGENFRHSMIFILGFTAALSIASNIDIIIVKNLTNSEIAGYYGALAVLGKIILWLDLAVVGVLLPEAFSLAHTGKPVRRNVMLGSYGLIALVSFPMLAIYFFFPQIPVSMLFGEKYLVVSNFLWAFGLMAVALAVLMLEAKLALARRDFSVLYCLGAVIVFLALAVNMFHNDLGQIALAVTVAFAGGWLLALMINMVHRFQPVTIEQHVEI